MQALLVIDVQTALVTGAYHEDEVISVINQAIEKHRSRNDLIIFIQHCHSSYEPMMKGNPGWQVSEKLKREDQDHFIEKTASDSFYNTALAKLLSDNGVEHVSITGLQTEFCVDTTCRSALSHGFGVTLISDGHTTGDAHQPAAKTIEHHNLILANLAHPTLSIQVKPVNEL